MDVDGRIAADVERADASASDDEIVLSGGSGGRSAGIGLHVERAAGHVVGAGGAEAFADRQVVADVDGTVALVDETVSGLTDAERIGGVAGGDRGVGTVDVERSGLAGDGGNADFAGGAAAQRAITGDQDRPLGEKRVAGVGVLPR